MKWASRFILLFFIATLMAGCKLAIIVVEGGTVDSRGSGLCVAGAICIVDVSEPGFSEHFGALPEDGWYFQKWNSGDGFFCGGSTDPTCTLSFQGHEESKAVEDMVASAETFYLMPIFKPYKDFITVDGKQWYQPSYFLNLSGSYIRAVCPAGKCDGVINGRDMTGWIWASVDEVSALFNTYGLDPPFTGPFQETTGDKQAYVAISQDFVTTAYVCYGDCPVTFEEVAGMVRDHAQPGEQPYTAYFRYLARGTIPSGDGVRFFNTGYTAPIPSEEVGVWFWRPAQKPD